MNERRHDSGQAMPRSTDRVDGWLRIARGPALVIAPGEAKLIAANSAGARLLGVDEKLAQAVPLDSTMPAIMDLRRAINRGARGREPVTPLVFWTPDGIARLRCHVEVIEDDGNPRLVFVEVVANTEAATAGRVSEHVARVLPDAAAEDPPRNEDALEPSAAISNLPDEVSPTRIDASLIDEPPQAHVSREAAVPREANAPSDTVAPREAAAPPASAEQPATLDHASTPKLNPTPAPFDRRHARPGPPSQHSSATTAIKPPPAAPPAPPPPQRNDEDTLKAIARQILAGRRAASKSTDRGAHMAAEAPSKPNGVATRQTREPTQPDRMAASPISPATIATLPTHARPVPGLTTSATAASMAAAAPSNPKDIRRSEPGSARAPAKSKSQSSDADAQSKRTHDEADRSGSARPTRARRVAHELKTPLSAIVSAAEIMKDQRLGSIGDERYLRYAQDIYESARHALEVIERMLGQARKDVKPYSERELSFTNLDINALAAGLLSGLEAMAQDAGLVLTSDLAPQLPLVVADATSVRQIVLNLITNALKFTPRGGHVLLVTRVDDHGQLTLSVSDTGPGLSAEDLAQITADAHGFPTDGSALHRPGGGLGIGLPLSQHLASANGASLVIGNSDDGGALATLAFPSNRQVPI